MAIKRSTVAWIVVTIVVAAVIAIMVLTLMGPTIGNVETCLAMGCASTLDIVFEGIYIEQYTVEISSPGAQTQAFDCTSFAEKREPFDESGCSRYGVHLRSMRMGGPMPTEVMVKVTWDGGTKTETFLPAYATNKPGGPECDLTCYNATITMQLP